MNFIGMFIFDDNMQRNMSNSYTTQIFDVSVNHSRVISYFRSSGSYWDEIEMNEVYHDSWKSAYMQTMQIGVCIVALMGFVGVFICICVLRI